MRPVCGWKDDGGSQPGYPDPEPASIQYRVLGPLPSSPSSPTHHGQHQSHAKNPHLNQPLEPFVMHPAMRRIRHQQIETPQASTRPGFHHTSQPLRIMGLQQLPRFGPKRQTLIALSQLPSSMTSPD